MKPTPLPGRPGEHEHAGETYILCHGDTLYRVTAASARDATAEVLAWLDDPEDARRPLRIPVKVIAESGGKVIIDSGAK